jgi:2-oxoisovalerate dehydrogenase E1 component
MHAERVDGYNPLAVIDAFSRKRRLCEEKKGPVLLDTVTYRTVGHSATDASTYRTKEEIEAWQRQDSIEAFGSELIRAKLAAQDELSAMREEIKTRITRIMSLAIDEKISPRINLAKDPDAIRKYMFSYGRRETMAEGVPETLIPLEENSRVKKLAAKSRFYLDGEGKEIGKLKQFTIRDALFEAIIRKFYKDPTLIAFGEVNRVWGGAFGV